MRLEPILTAFFGDQRWSIAEYDGNTAAENYDRLRWGGPAPKPSLADLLALAERDEVKPRRPLTREAVRLALAGLTAQQRNTLLAELVVERVLSEPRWARRLGVMLDGDEVAVAAAAAPVS